uniref:Uncharacterized protein n=1 Tax=viral metagenome TaxID=1070528 RepID=A0A6C0H859_9ZZZZ
MKYSFNEIFFILVFKIIYNNFRNIFIIYLKITINKFYNNIISIKTCKIRYIYIITNNIIIQELRKASFIFVLCI